MGELLSVIPQEKPWIILYVVIFLIFGQIAIFSKNTATEKLWLIGKFVRWFQTRKERSVAKERAARDDIRLLDLEQIDELKNMIEQERQEHKDQQHRFREELRELRGLVEDEKNEREKLRSDLNRKITEYFDYINYATRWARDVILMAAEHGWEPPIPAFKTFETWSNAAHENDT